MNFYKTRNQGVAALWRYLHGPSAHLRTYLEQPKGATFELDDTTGDAQRIVRQYHRDDGGSGFAVADAKAFLDEFIDVRKTLSTSIANGGEWRNSAHLETE